MDGLRLALPTGWKALGCSTPLLGPQNLWLLSEGTWTFPGDIVSRKPGQPLCGWWAPRGEELTPLDGADCQGSSFVA